MSDPFATGGAWLRRARRILFITGAGISADSGLPTYRGVGGLYENLATEDGLTIEEALSGAAFAYHPELTWKYLAQIERACRGARPNSAHYRIRQFQDSREVWVLTQNVDSFHRDVGTRNLIEIHGNLHDLRCTRCPHSEHVSDYADLRIPPACPACGALLRPAVVLFGELLSESALSCLYRELDRGFDCVVSVGTSGQFPYIAAPILQAWAQGVPTIEINPADTDLSATVELRLRTGAANGLEQLWRAFAVASTDPPGLP